MASFRKRGNGWYAEVAVHGARRGSTHSTKRAAQMWAAQKESELVTEEADGIPNLSFAELMQRYDNEVSRRKRGAKREHNMIAVILRDPVAKRPLREMTDHRLLAGGCSQAAEADATCGIAVQ